MRYQIIVLVLALLIIPVLCQPTNVGGTYGESWITNNGNKNVVPEATGLWNWGNIPKGQMLSNGHLTQSGPGFLIYPTLPTEGTTPMNATQLNNPYLTADPWYIAQSTEQPVLFRNLPY
jgi:hypothetical protein